ncbi:hypothetical protein AVEN_50317-1 [Araneus ventricosus]|uniref:Uncharacterized protein n=1 Tax=Araneus ventricosus TaxID=182803 RepID=A0A4Y2IAJ9_ARAVE|nr:hypothetical protein AVEN_50317-1 [Araneus ventricosus]
MGAHNFRTIAEVQQAILAWFHGLDADFFCAGFIPCIRNTQGENKVVIEKWDLQILMNVQVYTFQSPKKTVMPVHQSENTIAPKRKRLDTDDSRILKPSAVLRMRQAGSI